ncbi:MAG: Ycf66 family protein [Oscillatoriales cyanobacterium C42_A2020_001]|nr:Ycf66 family protein [Leptolyngbyaceae cyanobacterium C42_A2020_001]
MLAYILALVVGLGSFALYMAAFFFPEVHRKNDFIWSGVGLFYALVLWVYAGRITGGVLLGQIAGVSLLGWLGWQTFLLRRQVSPLDQQTALPTTDDVKAAFSNLSSPEGRSQLSQQASRTFGQLKEGIQGAIASATQPKPTVTIDEPYTPPKLEEFGTAGKEAIERFAKAAIPEERTVSETLTEATDQVQDSLTEAATDIAEQAESVATSVQIAAERAAKSVSASEPIPPNSPLNLPQKASNLVKVLTETIQSLLKSFSKKKETKPTYVRKQFRENKPTTELQVTDATVISVVEEIGRTADGSLVAEATIEIVSDELAPDLLAGALSDATAEEIVEELLEDISSQEQTHESGDEVPQAVPPHPPSPELVEAAIADAEEKGLPSDPPTPEIGQE